MFFFGNEVKNSWGTLATTDKLIKENPKMVGGFVRATIKALRYVRQDKEGTIAALLKFSGVSREQATRVYDDLIGTFRRRLPSNEEYRPLRPSDAQCRDRAALRGPQARASRSRAPPSRCRSRDARDKVPCIPDTLSAPKFRSCSSDTGRDGDRAPRNVR